MTKIKPAFSFQLSAFSISFLLLFLSAFAHAADQIQAQAAPKEPIVVNGDKVEYFHEKKEVIGTGNISITYKDAILTCDKVTVYLDTREAIAEGNVKVTQKGAYFTGEKMNYNFDTRKGTVLDGSLRAAPVYGKAAQVDKAANKDVFKLEKGYVTTCDLDHPHYRIEAKRVFIYLNDKVVAQHIVFYAGNIPVFYMPYYVQPLKKGGKQYITVIPGRQSDWGYFVLTAYRYQVNQYLRGDILFDYRTKKGPAFGLNNYYDTKKIGDGAFKFYYALQNQFVYQKTDDPTVNRYRYQFRHKWDMKDEDTTVTMEFNKLSDVNVIRDFTYKEYEELGINPDNYISVITSKRGYSTEFLVRPRLDKFYDVVERLPEYKINVFNQRLFKDLPLYYQASYDAAVLKHAFDNTTTSNFQKDLNDGRVDAYNQLSYTMKLLKTVSVMPYAGIRETYFSRTNDGETNAIRNIFNAGVNNSIKFYKLYDVDTDFMGLDIHKLRHVITPSVNYVYQYRPNIRPNRLIQFDEIDALDRRNGFVLALENRLQTKRPDSTGQMTSVDLATLEISTEYDLQPATNTILGTTDKNLQNINFQLELIPYSWAYLQSRWTVDPARSSIDTGSVDVVATGGDKWSVGTSYRYENVTSGLTDLVSVDAMYKINDKWRVHAYELFSPLKAAFQEQEITIDRDLHCWIAEFVVDMQNGNSVSFWFAMKLKAFPQYPIGLRKTYSRPRFGEAGAY